MAQVTIYLDEKTKKIAKKAARAEGVSLSRWIASTLRDKASASWPKAVLDLEGAWPDFPTAEEIRRSPARDLRREEL